MQSETSPPVTLFHIVAAGEAPQGLRVRVGQPAVAEG